MDTDLVADTQKSPVCRHCGLPIPKLRFMSLGALPPPLEDPPPTAFCCSGCEYVYRTISGLGLQEFYRYRIGTGQNAAAAAQPRGSSYAHFDEESFQSSQVVRLDSNRARVTLLAEGIHCAGCVWLIEKIPHVLNGVLECRVNFALGQVQVLYDPERVTLSRIARLLDSLGYPLHACSKSEQDQAERREDRQSLLRIAVAGICAANTMMLAVSLYQGLYTGMEDRYASFFRWVSLTLSLPAVFYSALPFYRSALSSLLLGTLHIDLPISLGLLAAFLFSVINTMAGRPAVYFDSVTALVFLILCGRWLQRRATRHARREARTGWMILPATARQVRETGLEEVPVGDLCVGATVEVLPAERIPVDGEVQSGESLVDMSVLSGESRPVAVAPGVPVFAGALNLESPVRITVRAGGEASRIGRLLRQVGGAGRRAAIVSLTDRLSHYFVGVVLVLALGTLCWWWESGPITALDNAVALLIITCPCALGLATPIAFTVAVGRAARQGILVRGEDALERLAQVRHVYFDKTGTLTEGKLAVADEVFEPELSEAQAVLWRSYALQLAAAVPSHPLSFALAQYLATAKHFGSPTLPRISYQQGKGISGVSAQDEKMYLGSLRWLSSLSVTTSAGLQACAAATFQSGQTIVGFAAQGRVVLLFGLQDSVRDEAAAIVSRIVPEDGLGFVVSGDEPAVVSFVSEQCGIPRERAFGQLFPEEKSHFLREDSMSTAMIGDGVNDAPAMRAAGVSIGLRGGAEVGLEVADLYIVTNGLRGAAEAFEGARQTMSVVKRNLFLSLVYNVLGAGAAMCGYVNPLVAAVLMPISSLSVIGSSVVSGAFSAKAQSASGRSG